MADVSVFAHQAASKRGYERRVSWNVALEICPGSKLSKLQQFPLKLAHGDRAVR